MVLTFNVSKENKKNKSSIKTTPPINIYAKVNTTLFQTARFLNLEKPSLNEYFKGDFHS